MKFFKKLKSKEKRKEDTKKERYGLTKSIESGRKEKLSEEARRQFESELNYLQSLPNRCESMKLFEPMLQDYWTMDDRLRDYRRRGGKVVGTLCAVIPNELILAAGAFPLRLCSGLYSGAAVGSETLSDGGLCPLVKTVLGLKIMNATPLFELCDLLIAPTTCDGKIKLAEILGDYVPVHIVNLPHVKEGDAVKSMWLKEIRHLAFKIEELTGKRIERKGLRRVIETTQRAQDVWHRFNEARKNDKVPVWGREAMLLPQLTFFSEITSWTRNMEKLCDEVDRRVRDGIGVHKERAPRIMLAGSPIIWPNWKLPNIVEEAGAIIVCDELCTSNRVLSDRLVVDEYTMSGMVEALAERYLYPCSCPCFTPNDERQDMIIEMIRKYNVEGVIYHILRGCHLGTIEFTRIQRTLKSQDIPVLRIESEYEKGDVGQVKIRVEAFMEILHGRREEDMFS